MGSWLHSAGRTRQVRVWRVTNDGGGVVGDGEGRSNCVCDGQCQRLCDWGGWRGGSTGVWYLLQHVHRVVRWWIGSFESDITVRAAQQEGYATESGGGGGATKYREYQAAVLAEGGGGGGVEEGGGEQLWLGFRWWAGRIVCTLAVRWALERPGGARLAETCVRRGVSSQPGPFTLALPCAQSYTYSSTASSTASVLAVIALWKATDGTRVAVRADRSPASVTSTVASMANYTASSPRRPRTVRATAVVPCTARVPRRSSPIMSPPSTLPYTTSTRPVHHRAALPATNPQVPRRSHPFAVLPNPQTQTQTSLPRYCHPPQRLSLVPVHSTPRNGP